MLACKVAGLGGLSIDNAVSILDVVVNEFPVLDVDEWAEVRDGGEYEAEAPDWRELNQEVGAEGRGAGLYTR